MLRIKKKLQSYIHLLQGDFTVKEKHYEERLCSLLEWECYNDRYFDAFNGESFIEIKKGLGHMFYNMIRYAEIYLKCGKQDTITLFMRYNKSKKRIDEVLIIDTQKILDFLDLSATKASLCIYMKKTAKRQIHIQASATLKDMRQWSSYIVYHPKYLFDMCMKEIQRRRHPLLRKKKKRKRIASRFVTVKK